MIVKLKPKLALSLVQAQSIVDRAAPGRMVARVSELQGGEISAIFQIDLADGSRSLILKVYPDSLHWKMRKEVTVSRLLEGRLTVPVPRIILADDTKLLLDLNYIVMSKLDGGSLIERERDGALGPSKILTVYSQMGKALLEIHAITMEAFGYIGPDGVLSPHATNRSYMSTQFARKLAEFTERGGPAGTASRFNSFVEDRLTLLEACAVPRLCHCDFHTGNILVAERNGALGLSGLLDMENAIAGDPLMDIARTLNYAIRDDETKKAGFMAGYGRIERPNLKETLALYKFYDLLELWCWWTQIGDHERVAGLMPSLQRYA